VDTTAAMPRGARALTPAYRDYLVEVTSDETVAILARDPDDPSAPSMQLAFDR